MEIKEAIQGIKTISDLKQVIQYYGINLEEKGKEIKGCCPFHSEKTPSFHITDKGNGAYYHCFGCKAHGDIINFIQAKEGSTTLEAVKKAYDILGLKCDLEPSKLDKLKDYIEKNFKDYYKDKNYKYDDTHIYDDENNIPVLARIKYKNKETGKKQYSQANILDAGEHYKLDFKGNKPNLLYNLPKVIKEDKSIYIVEGEKDADTLNKLGFVATTSREVSSLNSDIVKPLYNGKIIAIGDNDDTGAKHIDNIRKLLKPNVKSFKVPIFDDLTQLGNKADISDLVEHYYNKNLTKDNISKIINNKVFRTLDENNIYELQQDHNGIYQTIAKVDKNTGETTNHKNYITNFSILNCEILRNKDTQDQIIRLTIQSNLETKDTIEANARELFLDVKNFKKVLGVDYIFSGKNADLLQLNQWILKYKTNKDIEEYTITGIREINGKNVLITNNGTLDSKGKWNTEIKARNTLHDIDFEGITELSEIEAKKLAKNLFKVNTKQNIVNSLGLGIAQLYNSYARDSKIDNLPVLQDIGESNSGKSIMIKLLKLIINNEKPAKSFGNCSPFVITKMLNETFLPVFVDEMKPSKAGIYKTNGWSEHIRAITEGYENEKGRKDQSTIIYKYNASLILSGEEQITETAVTNRSNIVWYTRNNFTDEGAEAVNYLLKTNEGQELLKRFSLTLYKYVLTLGKEGFEEKYNEIKKIDFNITDERIKNTAIYTTLGFVTLSSVFKHLKVNISEYVSLKEVIDLVKNNLHENVLDKEVAGGKAEYEVILELMDKIELIEQCDYKYTRDKQYIQIDITGIWDRISKYIKDYNVDIKLLNKDTFIKMLTKSKYVAGENSKDYYMGISLKKHNSFDVVKGKYTENRSAKVYKLKIEELQNLYMPNLAPRVEEFEEIENAENIIPF